SLPFLAKASSKQFITIFSEAEKHILCLRVFNSETDSNDLLFIDFKSDPGIFSTALFSKSSEIQYKDMLAEFISTSVNAVVFQAKNERATFKKITAHVVRMLELSQENKELAEKEKELHKQSVENLIKEYVNKLSLQYNRNFLISDAALSLLWEHRDSMFAIQDMVEDAIIFSLSQFPSEASNIVLHEEYFTIPTQSTTENISYSPEIKTDISRSQKNEQFLYRLKSGVELAISKKLSPTGKNVGRLCDPPITAPGISEYLSKYSVSIANIIHQNQERWAILTENFRPIQNLMANSSMRLKRAN
ncbi:MAG: hypothetical protein GX879_00950, partial [Bacteroidales bacterium]|nr:hypothetical protein [Bacteroidales bacterium]